MAQTATIDGKQRELKKTTQDSNHLPGFKFNTGITLEDYCLDLEWSIRLWRDLVSLVCCCCPTFKLCIYIDNCKNNKYVIFILVCWFVFSSPRFWALSFNQKFKLHLAFSCRVAWVTCISQNGRPGIHGTPRSQCKMYWSQKAIINWRPVFLYWGGPASFYIFIKYILEKMWNFLLVKGTASLATYFE